MSVMDLERIEGLLFEIKEELARRGATPLPTLLTMKAAGTQLSVGRTKMAELTKSGVVLTVDLDGRQMVPASEIVRLSQVDRPKVALTPKAMRLAASLSKLKEPLPGAKEAAVRMRHARRPRAGQSQDFSELDGLLKARPKKKR